ncbi:MAG: hypothetical protein Q7S33_02395 [Nanoarchaeota archaeon]|nr:hypothetical protein [Nanoarchaeota archaeon]
MITRKVQIIVALFSILFVLTALSIVGPCSKANGENAKTETPITASWDNTYSSKYVFWGIQFSNKDVYQSLITINKGHSTLFVFSNRDFETSTWNEHDVFFDYTTPINKMVNMSAGYNYYNCRLGDWESYNEIYIGASFNTFLSPAISYHNIFGFENGNYFEASVSKSFQINDKITLLSSGKLGYNDKAFRTATDFSHTEWGISAPITYLPHFIISPFAKYSFALADDLKNVFYGGATASYKF